MYVYIYIYERHLSYTNSVLQVKIRVLRPTFGWRHLSDEIAVLESMYVRGPFED
jgi:hypothetical protein